MVKNKWIKDAGYKYYITPDGTPARGKYNIAGEEYYFKETGELAINEEIDGYVTDENGLIKTNVEKQEEKPEEVKTTELFFCNFFSFPEPQVRNLLQDTGNRPYFRQKLYNLPV